MALPTASPHRMLKHRRQIDVQIQSRGDSCWEVEAHISDVKTRDAVLASAVRPAGQPIHDMPLRLVVDEQFNILACGAQTDAMPYTGFCDKHGDAYGQLVGLNLLTHFRQGVKARLVGVKGCPHLTEWTQVLPTAVAQPFTGEVNTIREGQASESPRFQINRRHALRDDAPAVALHYPSVRFHKSCCIRNPWHPQSQRCKSARCHWASLWFAPCAWGAKCFSVLTQTYETRH